MVNVPNQVDAIPNRKVSFWMPTGDGSTTSVDILTAILETPGTNLIAQMIRPALRNVPSMVFQKVTGLEPMELPQMVRSLRSDSLHMDLIPQTLEPELTC